MTTTPTTNINATLQQIAELTASGCDIVRVAVPTRTTRMRCKIIAKKSQIPVIADIHFQPKYVFQAIDAGCAARPREPGQHPQVRRPGRRDRQGRQGCRGRIRIGVNAGSLDPRLLQKYGKATPEALVESAVWEASLFEEHDFHDFKISVKHNDPIVMVKAYRLLAERGDWPLHLGVTEAGPAFQGTIKSRDGLRHPAVARASATPSASRSPPRRSRRSRSACRSCSRSTCASASSRSSPARRAAAPRSTSTRSPTT